MTNEAADKAFRELYGVDVDENNLTTVTWRKAWQACEAQMRLQYRLTSTFCKCGHSLELHDDQAVCRALVDGKKSCQCMQFETQTETEISERVRSAVEESRKQLSIESMEREPCGHFKSNLIGDEYGHFLCDACQIETERVRAAVAEMREKVLTLVGFSEEIVLVEKSEFRNLTRKILAIPLDGDPNWLEKQLLDARKDEVRYADSWLVKIVNISDEILEGQSQRYDVLTAERRALEGGIKI